MNGEQWAAVEELGPPPEGDGWFPMARWDCSNDHTEVGGLSAGYGKGANCSICGARLRKINAVWIKALDR